MGNAAGDPLDSSGGLESFSTLLMSLLDPKQIPDNILRTTKAREH